MTIGGHFEEILLLVKLHSFSSWVTLSKPHVDKLAVNFRKMVHKWLANILYTSLMVTAKKASSIIFYLCLTHSSYAVLFYMCAFYRVEGYALYRHPHNVMHLSS